MRIVVDRDLCQGHGVCESEAPGVFSVSKQGVLTVLEETPPTSRRTEVEQAVRSNDVVVVGMAQNPHVRNVKKALDQAEVSYEYLEYGSYLSEWKRRLAIKLWSGWPTFPQVFVKGTLLGGEDLTKAAIADGSLKKRLTGS